MAQPQEAYNEDEDRQDRLDQTSADAANPRTQERSQDDFTPAKPSGKSPGEHIRALFAEHHAKEAAAARDTTPRDTPAPTGKSVREIAQTAVARAQGAEPLAPVKPSGKGIRGHLVEGFAQSKLAEPAEAPPVAKPVQPTQPVAQPARPTAPQATRPAAPPTQYQFDVNSPPPSWKNERARTAWANLDPDVRHSIKQDEHEHLTLRDHKAKHDKVYTPQRMAYLKEIGRTPEEFGETAWMWDGALRNPNESARTHAWLMAAQAYNIRLPEIRYENGAERPTVYNGPAPMESYGPPPTKEQQERIDTDFGSFNSRNAEHMANEEIKTRLWADLGVPRLLKSKPDKTIDLDAMLHRVLYGVIGVPPAGTRPPAPAPIPSHTEQVRRALKQAFRQHSTPELPPAA
jgi:hypothetical protein